MDPDRYQMKDMKRRIAALEASDERSNARIRKLQNEIIQIHEGFILKPRKQE